MIARHTKVVSLMTLLVAGCAQPEQLLAPGDVLASTLSLEQFQAQHGGSNKWVLCNGITYPQSAFANATGDATGKVPDLRGRYPRGFMAGQTPAVGQTQEDALQNHSHVLGGWSEMGDARGGGDNHVLRTGFGGNTGTSGPVGANVANETRPKTTVVNFFCRAN